MPAETIALFQNVGYLVISILLVITLYTIFSPILEGDKLKRRMASVANAREDMKKTRQAELNSKDGLRPESKDIIRTLVDRLSLQKLLEASDLKDKLAQAGLRGQKPIYTFYMVRLIAPIALFALGILLFVLINVRGWTFLQNVLATMSMTLFGFYLPGIYVSNVANKRLANIVPVFPDALDLLLICVESGMSVELAFGRVAGGVFIDNGGAVLSFKSPRGL